MAKPQTTVETQTTEAPKVTVLSNEVNDLLSKKGQLQAGINAINKQLKALGYVTPVKAKGTKKPTVQMFKAGPRAETVMKTLCPQGKSVLQIVMDADGPINRAVICAKLDELYPDSRLGGKKIFNFYQKILTISDAIQAAD